METDTLDFGIYLEAKGAWLLHGHTAEIFLIMEM